MTALNIHPQRFLWCFWWAWQFLYPNTALLRKKKVSIALSLCGCLVILMLSFLCFLVLWPHFGLFDTLKWSHPVKDNMNKVFASYWENKAYCFISKWCLGLQLTKYFYIQILTTRRQKATESVPKCIFNSYGKTVYCFGKRTSWMC